MLKNDSELLQEITSLCQDDKIEDGKDSGDEGGCTSKEDDIFNMSTIPPARLQESEFNSNENMEINALISQFTKVDMRLSMDILDKMKYAKISRAILSEDERILDYFVARVPKCQSLDEVVQLLEALYFEQKIRIGDKSKFADQLKSSLEKQSSSFRQAESVIKRSRIK